MHMYVRVGKRWERLMKFQRIPFHCFLFLALFWSFTFLSSWPKQHMECINWFIFSELISTLTSLNPTELITINYYIIVCRSERVPWLIVPIILNSFEILKIKKHSGYYSISNDLSIATSFICCENV